MSGLAQRRPSWRGTAVRRAAIPLIWRLRPRGYIANCFRRLALLEKTQWLPLHQLAEIRLAALQRLVRHASERSPYYRDLFQRFGISPKEIRSFDDLRALPPLTRTQVQEHWRSMMTCDPAQPGLMRNASGGSSGQPVVFYHDHEELWWRSAAALRHDQWTGWRVGERTALVWGAARDFASVAGDRRRLNQVLFPELLIDASSLDDEMMAAALGRLERWQPRLLLGYANALYAFARFAAERGHRVRPTGIIATAEVLDQARGRFIEEVFGCPIYERYGAREFGVIASQCEHRGGLHVNAEKLHVELDEERADEAGRAPILITDLVNMVMPMIRYEIGDLGLRQSSECACGRALPSIAGIVGRVTDFIVTPSGKRVSGVAAATYLITNCPGVGQVQIVQRALDHVVLRCVVSDGFDAAAKEKLIARGREFFGDGVSVEVEQVETIPRGPTGKWRFSISMVDRDRSERD
jgi:phenylacetate-CoA ligase